MVKLTRKPINWVLCAAGEGQRFRKYGILTPKPLLMLHGLTFLERSLLSIDLVGGDHLVIISQAKDGLRERLSERIEKLYPSVNLDWVELSEITSGQLDTFYMAKEKLNCDLATGIYNSDTYFKSFEFDFMLRNSPADSIVPCGEMLGDAWSFFKLDSDKNVCEVKEKQRISKHASVGMYYFKDTKILLENTRLLLKQELKEELFVSKIFDLMMEQKRSIQLAKVDSFLPFGTIEQLGESWDLTKEEFLEQHGG